MIQLPELERVLAELTPGEALLLQAEIDAELGHRRLEDYVPNKKQALFHRLGKRFRQRMLMAGNQQGKTMSAGAEVAMHLSGRYPDWWEGRTFDKPTVGWVAGVTSDALRDGVQRMLFGRTQRKTLKGFGTGMIPKDALREKPSWRQHSNDVIDTAVIRHGGGGDVQAGHSLVVQKSYDQGREKFQADTLDFVWLDEEPPYPVYSECLTRTNVSLGPVLLTFTPLMGMTETVRTFLIDKVLGSIVVNMTIDDADHYTAEQKAAIIAGYKPHERLARIMGKPAMGSGAVFPIPEEQIKVKPFPIPRHWVHIVGMDFGSDHPTAAVWLAWDRDTDTVYIIATYRRNRVGDGDRPIGLSEHALAIKSWGDWLPVAWPHDGLQHDKAGASELNIAEQYRDAGLAMLPDFAQFEEMDDGKGGKKKGGYGLEAGITDMYDRMLKGKLRVFSHLNDWFEEFQLYHRKDGLIVPILDDILSATRYALMMRRFAVARPLPRHERPEARRANWRTAS